jgi:hypothetical protein
LQKALLIDPLEISDARVECMGECILTAEVKTMAKVHAGMDVNFNGMYGTQRQMGLKVGLKAERVRVTGASNF